MKTQTKKSTNFITEILQHGISWFVRSNSVKELDESTIEHIEECIKDGYTQGEIVMTYGRHRNLETTGWWHIINWQDIALQLYNSLPTIKTAEQQKAADRFNEEWTY